MKRLAFIPLLFLITGVSARADVASRASDSLGTRINGVLDGRCQSGLCRISGGSDSGRNRFHRLSEFDTRGAIQGVSIDSDGIRNLVLGVTAADGSFIDKSVSLSSPAHLFLLSPGGIQLMPGASFQQIPQLTLSTASQLRFAGGVFDVFNSPLTAIPGLGGDPLPGALGLLSGDLAGRRPLIRMEGVSLDIDESLLVDAPGGHIDVLNSRLSVSNAAGDGGSLTLTGDLVSVGEGSQLLATGTVEGGLVQVGGSWQNSDPTVRQASQTWMKPGSVVDASSTGSGNGGTVVIWSDLNNPSGGTVAQGTLLARGGDVAGNGGQIETSGPVLVAEPERLDVTAANGLSGDWLLDPFDITIGSGQTNITPDSSVSGQLFQSSSSGSFVSAAEIGSALISGNVIIQTGPSDDSSESGNITWESGASIDYSSSSANLVLDATGDIELNSSITTGSGGLSLDAEQGYVASSSGITLALNGPLNISTGNTTIGTSGDSSPPLMAATLTGSGNLNKSGAGRLIVSGDSSSWSGNTTIQAGTLRATATNALGTGSYTKAQSGAIFEVAGGISLGENVELDGGKLLSLSGDNSITLPVLLRSSSTIEVKQDSLTLSDTVSSDSGVSASLTLAGAGDITLQDALNLGDSQIVVSSVQSSFGSGGLQSSSAPGDILHIGSGTARFKGSLNVTKVESTGGGTVWMDQPSGSEVLPDISSIFLDNASFLRRDSSETVTNTSLKLGSGGGGISVGSGFDLVWDAAVTGSGSFTKAGGGTLTFPATASISYTGSTFVSDGSLVDLSSSASPSSVSGGSGSDAVTSSPTDTSIDTSTETTDAPTDPPTDVPIDEIDEVEIDETSDLEEQQDVAEVPFDDDQLEELVVIAEVSVLTSNESSSAAGSDSSSSASGGSITTQSQAVGPVLQVDVGSGGDSAASVAGTTAPPPAASGSPQTVSPEQAVAEFQKSDESATSRTASLLGLPQDALRTSLRSVEDVQNILSRVKRDGLAPNPAVLQVRFTQQTSASNGQDEDAFLDLTLIGSDAPVEARRVSLNRGRFSSLLKALYRQLSRQEPLAVDDPASPSRQLHALLVAPILESLQGQEIETLLIAADQGLQAVPFAALSDGTSFFGEKYAFGLTPSLALTPLAPSQSSSGRQLALGASEFETLAPLPLVPQELEQLEASAGADRYLNDDFSPQALLNGAADQRYDRVHVATHADFRPGGPAQSVLHTGTGPMSMAQLAKLRSERRDTPLDLIVFSACRTLLGDPDSELGFAGLALQAGARSAVGTLWYVDDVVTSAFFVQFYRLLDQGLPKAEALQRTRQLFASGAIQLQGDVVVGAGEVPLLTELTPAQRRRIAGGVQHPYFWSGIELIGSAW